MVVYTMYIFFLEKLCRAHDILIISCALHNFYINAVRIGVSYSVLVISSCDSLKQYLSPLQTNINIYLLFTNS